MGNDEWHVVPVDDFDAVFEARGVKPMEFILNGDASAPWKEEEEGNEPQKLIKFAAPVEEEPEECKDCWMLTGYIGCVKGVWLTGG